MTDEQLFTVAEVAERLKAHPQTVRGWLKSGRLRGFLPGGDRLGWRVRASDLKAFIEGAEGQRES